MNDTYISLSSLSMDLKRVALASQRNSLQVADRFLQEALKRKNEIDTEKIKPYIRNLLIKIEKSLQSEDRKQQAEDALMYSILFQNAALASKDA